MAGVRLATLSREARHWCHGREASPHAPALCEVATGVRAVDVGSWVVVHLDDLDIGARLDDVLARVNLMLQVLLLLVDVVVDAVHVECRRTRDLRVQLLVLLHHVERLVVGHVQSAVSLLSLHADRDGAVLGGAVQEYLRGQFLALARFDFGLRWARDVRLLHEVELLLLLLGLRDLLAQTLILLPRQLLLLVILELLALHILNRLVQLRNDVGSVSVLDLGLGQGLLLFFLHFTDSQEITRRHFDGVGSLNELTVARRNQSGSIFAVFTFLLARLRLTRRT